jgi:uncharacterized membrane protein YraQ (UPF0718 family)
MNTALQTLKWPVKLVPIFADRVVAPMILSLVALSLINGPQAVESLRFVTRSTLQIFPFFALAVVFAAYAKASGADRLIARAFSGNTAVAIVVGSLAGALSPFCSCGVIPLIAAMLASGVPLAPVMAFCIASPVMDPEMFILTAAGISLNFAVAKTATAIGMGLLAGFGVGGLQRLGYIRHPVKNPQGCGSSQPDFDPHSPVEVSWRFWREAQRNETFGRQVKENGWFLGKWLTFAFFIESLMIAYLPAESVGSLVGVDSPLAIPIAAIIGIPAYMNGYAAIPLISGLMQLGMTPAAALSFVTAGAVSSIPAALAVYALVKRSVFVVYLTLGLVGSMTAGVLYQLAELF